jgi:hypothetical protein
MKEPGRSLWLEMMRPKDEPEAGATETPPTTIAVCGLLVCGAVFCGVVLSKSAVPVGVVDCGAGVAVAAGDALDDAAAALEIVVVDVAKIPPGCAPTPIAPPGAPKASWHCVCGQPAYAIPSD